MPIGPTILALAGTVDVAATGQLVKELTGTARARFPKLKPGDILKAALEIESLQERGLQPIAGTDPFTGNLLVGSADQDLFGLSRERAQRIASAPSEAALRQFGQAVEAIRQPPETVAQTVVPAGSGGSVTAKLQNGAVVRARTSATANPRSRLGGPCAGAVSSIDRIRCNIGGVT